MHTFHIEKSHSILSDPSCDSVTNDELDMESSNKISFLNKNNNFLIDFIYSIIEHTIHVTAWFWIKR